MNTNGGTDKGPVDVADLRARIQQAIKQHRILFMVQGVVLIVLGALAIVLPHIATLVVEIFIGWFLLIAGIVQLLSAFTARREGGFWWAVVGAILALLAGALLLARPLEGVLTLTLILAVFFFAEGLVRAALALQMRGVPGWGWGVASGVISFVLGALIITQLPGSAAWILGLLVGVNLLFVGASLLSTAMAAGRT